MRYIIKGPECDELIRWKRSHPNGTYYELSKASPEIRREIRKALLKEQYGLCAFCCDRVTLDSGRNAHIKPQSIYPQESLNWQNIVVSCPSVKSCDNTQERTRLPISPLMENCEAMFKFYETGEIVGLNEDAQKTIEILNLDNEILRRKRKNAICTLCYENGIDPLSDFFLDFNDLDKKTLINTLTLPDEDGNLPAFLPVLINIIRANIENQDNP